MKTIHANRFNAFVLGNAGAIGEILSSLLGEPTPGDANGVFRERAAALVGALTPVLVWMREHKGAPLNIDTVRLSFELRSFWKLVLLSPSSSPAAPKARYICSAVGASGYISRNFRILGFVRSSSMSATGTCSKTPPITILNCPRCL